MQSPSEGDVLRGHVIQEDLGGQQRRFGIHRLCCPRRPLVGSRTGEQQCH